MNLLKLLDHSVLFVFCLISPGEISELSCELPKTVQLPRSFKEICLQLNFVMVTRVYCKLIETVLNCFYPANM